MKKKRFTAFLGASSTLLLVAVCCGVTPDVLGGFPVLPSALGIMYSIISNF